MFLLFGAATIFSRHFGYQPGMATTSALFDCALLLRARRPPMTAARRESGKDQYPFPLLYVLLHYTNAKLVGSVLELFTEVLLT